MAESMVQLNRDALSAKHLAGLARLAVGAVVLGGAIGATIRAAHGQGVAAGIVEGGAASVAAALTSCYLSCILDWVFVRCGLHEDLSPAAASILAVIAALAAGIATMHQVWSVFAADHGVAVGAEAAVAGTLLGVFIRANRFLHRVDN